MTYRICIWFCILYLLEALPCLLPVVLWEMLWTEIAVLCLSLTAPPFHYSPIFLS